MANGRAERFVHPVLFEACAYRQVAWQADRALAATCTHALRALTVLPT